MALLERNDAVFLFCVLRQAERSVDTGVWPGRWPEVRDYYAGPRLELLRKVTAELWNLAGTRAPIVRSEHRHKVRVRWDAWGQFLHGLCRPILLRQRFCRLRPEELRFMATTLEDLIHLLQREQPEQAEVVWLRTDLGFGMSLVGCRCGDVPRKAWDVENLAQPDHRHYAIHEIVQPTNQWFTSAT